MCGRERRVVPNTPYYRRVGRRVEAGLSKDKALSVCGTESMVLVYPCVRGREPPCHEIKTSGQSSDLLCNF